jgi:hypothetical protein
MSESVSCIHSLNRAQQASVVRESRGLIGVNHLQQEVLYRWWERLEDGLGVGEVMARVQLPELLLDRFWRALR